LCRTFAAGRHSSRAVEDGVEDSDVCAGGGDGDAGGGADDGGGGGVGVVGGGGGSDDGGGGTDDSTCDRAAYIGSRVTNRDRRASAGQTCRMMGAGAWESHR
jgi:hypothetical protein